MELHKGYMQGVSSRDSPSLYTSTVSCPRLHAPHGHPHHHHHHAEARAEGLSTSRNLPATSAPEHVQEAAAGCKCTMCCNILRNNIRMVCLVDPYSSRENLLNGHGSSIIIDRAARHGAAAPGNPHWPFDSNVSISLPIGPNYMAFPGTRCYISIARHSHQSGHAADKLCSSNSQEQMLGKKYYSLHGHGDLKNGVTKSNLLAVNGPVNDHSRTTVLKVFPFLQPSVLCPQEPGFAMVTRQQVFKEGGSFCKAHTVPFPLDPSRDVEVSSDPCTRSSTSGHQLTIFYKGQVNVYNNVSSAMAQHIVLLAGGDHPSVQYLELFAKDYASQLAYCRPHVNADQNEKILNIINVSGRPYTTQANEPSACSRMVQDNLEDSSIARLSDKEAEPVIPQSLLQARKASLARFLERRKARLMTTFPYHCWGTNHKHFM